jgi:hypothetical protein
MDFKVGKKVLERVNILTINVNIIIAANGIILYLIAHVNRNVS